MSFTSGATINWLFGGHTLTFSETLTTQGLDQLSLNSFDGHVPAYPVFLVGLAADQAATYITAHGGTVILPPPPGGGGSGIPVGGV
jgi:hypothetical protein